MKKLLNLLFLLFLVAGSVIAQAVAVSSTYTLPVQGDNMISCSNNGNYVVTYVPGSVSGYNHRFVIEDMTTGAKKVLRLFDEPSRFYELTDIAMAGDMCYFCGRMTEGTAEAALPGQLTETGFVGCFDASVVMLGAGDYGILKVKGTNILTGIAASDMDQGVMAIGIPSSLEVDTWGGYITCVVGLNRRSSHIWKYDIALAHQDGEYMRDITYSNDGYFIASEFANDNFSFGVRYVKHPPLSEDCWFSQLNRLNRFNTQPCFVSPLSSYVAQRIENTGVFIDNHTVAYACADAESGNYGVALYRMQLTSMFAFEAVQMSQAQFAETSQGARLLDIANYCHGTSNAARINEYVSMLLDDRSNDCSVVRRAVWMPSAMYTQPDLRCQNSSARLSSLVSYGSGVYLHIAGRKSITNRLVMNTQHSRFVDRPAGTCLDNTQVGNNYSMSTVMPTFGGGLDRYSEYWGIEIGHAELVGLIEDVDPVVNCSQMGVAGDDIFEIENPIE